MSGLSQTWFWQMMHGKNVSSVSFSLSAPRGTGMMEGAAMHVVRPLNMLPQSHSMACMTHTELLAAFYDQSRVTTKTTAMLGCSCGTWSELRCARQSAWSGVISACLLSEGSALIVRSLEMLSSTFKLVICTPHARGSWARTHLAVRLVDPNHGGCL